MFHYTAPKFNFNALPATTQPQPDRIAEMQLTDRMTFVKPNMYTSQLLNHLAVLLIEHIVYHMGSCKTKLAEHSDGVQHMRLSNYLLWNMRK